MFFTDSVEIVLRVADGVEDDGFLMTSPFYLTRTVSLQVRRVLVQNIGVFSDRFLVKFCTELRGKRPPVGGFLDGIIATPLWMSSYPAMKKEQDDGEATDN